MPPAPRPEVDAPDGTLVRQVAAGEDAALEALYDRYGRPAFALARRITGEQTFAEEIVEEVFLALWRDPEKYDPARGGFPSWLLATTHHKAVDAVRREETVRRPAPTWPTRPASTTGAPRTSRRWRTPPGPACAASGSGRPSGRCRSRSARRWCWRTTPVTPSARSRSG